MTLPLKVFQFCSHRLRVLFHKKITLFWFLFFIGNFSSTYTLFAQTEIPLGTWRAHVSYNAIRDIALAGDKVYAMAANGIMVVDRSDNSVSTLTKLNGLSGADLSAINFDVSTNQLLITYADGRFDIVKDNRIHSFDPSQNSPLTGSKRINGIAIQNSLAYLAADYGVVVFDLMRTEIKETWRDIGPNGTRLKIFQAAFLNDSVFLATETGVMGGDLTNNLLDYNRWKRFDENDLNTSIPTITSFNDKIYVANDGGIYSYVEGTWIKEEFLPDVEVKSLRSSASHLLIVEDSRLWLLNTGNALTPVSANSIAPTVAVEDTSGKLWIGDKSQGLVSNISGSFTNYLPNGPGTASAFRLTAYDNKMYLISGGFTTTFQGLNLPGVLNVFESGAWKSFERPIDDITDVAISSSGKVYLSSFGYGIEEIDTQGDSKIFDETNSSLVNLSPPARNVNVTAVEAATEGLWAANYGAEQSLHRFSGNAWQSFSFPVAASRYPVDLAVDFSERVWMVLNPAQGGGILVFDPGQNKHNYLINDINSGGLPDRSVRSIALDREGNMWVGTDRGVAYFFDAFSDAIKPIYENRFLLTDERITAIAVDGGNRKWIGTERGVWLFNPTGEELIHNFTAENSPLFSNRIADIEINASTGEVFLATDLGVASFRSDASQGLSRFQEIKIFPNPITYNYTGQVGITGLATDAVVKITDVRGKLLFQTQAHGGTASWNLRDYSGKRVSTGIFLVFVAKQDASENRVGKIVVID